MASLSGAHRLAPAQVRLVKAYERIAFYVGRCAHRTQPERQAGSGTRLLTIYTHEGKLVAYPEPKTAATSGHRLLQPVHGAGAKANGARGLQYARAFGQQLACGWQLLRVSRLPCPGEPGVDALRIIARSNSPNAPQIWNINRPLGVVVSIAC